MVVNVTTGTFTLKETNINNNRGILTDYLLAKRITTYSRPNLPIDKNYIEFMYDDININASQKLNLNSDTTISGNLNITGGDLTCSTANLSVISCNSNSFYLKGIDSIKIELLRSNGNFSLSFGNITALSINYDTITPQYNFKIATSSLIFTRSAVTFSLTNSSTTSIIFKTVSNSNFSSPLFAMNYKGIQANGPTCNYSFGFNTLTVDGLGWNFGNQCLFTNSIGKSAGTQCVLPNKSGTLALTSDIGNLRVLKNQSEDSMFVYIPALEFRGTTLISIHTSPFMPDSGSTYVCFY